MEAYEYIRKVKTIDPIESISKFSYGLDIDEVIKLMEGYAQQQVRNIDSIADVVGSSSSIKFPENDEGLKAFDEKYRHYKHELTGEEIDPYKLLNDLRKDNS